MERDHHVILGDSQVDVDVDVVGPHCNSPFVREERVLGEHPVAITVRDHQRATTTLETTTAASTPTAANMATIWFVRPNRCILHLPTHVA